MNIIKTWQLLEKTIPTEASEILTYILIVQMGARNIIFPYI